MDDRPRPAPNVGIVPAPPPPPRVSRRWLLAGGAAVVLGGGAGAGAELLRKRPRSRPVPPPAPPRELLAAIEAERALIADLDATTGGTAPVRRVLEQARADHAAHLQALRGALAAYRVPAATPRRRGRPRTRAQLRQAEQAAAAAAGRRAAAMTGSAATLLASIAACEATHAALL